MVELRKRKTPPPAPAPAPKKERKTKATKANEKSETAAEPAAPEPSAVPAAAPEPETKAASGTPKPGDKIDFEGFGGEVETNDGRKVTLKSLVDESKEGVVLFTYPKASTPGCESLRSRGDIACLCLILLIADMMTSRHNSSLPFQRLVSTIDRSWTQHLRSEHRFTQGQHDI
jgi:hypothetical protein